MVVSVCKAVEWQSNDLSQAEGAIAGYAGVRCLRKLGVWSIFPRQVVLTRVGRELEECSHFS